MATRSPAEDLELVSKNRCFDGFVFKYQHISRVLGGVTMRFNIFLPLSAIGPSGQNGAIKVPVLYFLSGLTCTEDNMITKSGAIKYLSEEGIALVTPDTSPRNAGVEGEDDSWDLGTGAGFYIDAVTDKWARHYKMYSYIAEELPALINNNFNVGGHGALVLAMRNPGRYRSVSAFAPICNPCECELGQKAFAAYLGNDKSLWEKYDACCLVKEYKGPNLNILLDQGSDDQFLKQGSLLPDHFMAAAENNKECVKIDNHLHPSFDHSYWFVQTFMENHIRFHAKYLKN
ncbi:hypothetical protein EV182_004088 [Spiromyces aspiralis]|uniref:Uncharacterized protein n=1 Tax=Spiromyces aspiralis TaxID=68401 RepID=A0ACC1HSV8_9FUNG|nr:hypothetical protein EV182_004088 [Spiromyces aspiralis]